MVNMELIGERVGKPHTSDLNHIYNLQSEGYILSTVELQFFIL